VFTRAAVQLFSDDEYQTLQLTLLLRPKLGKSISGSGGLRKLRWGTRGKGKRGGSRIIYYWHESSETFYMLYVFPKNAQEDLSHRQLKELSRLVREEFDEQE
jgi:hypothetical protein